jgi:ribosomal protein S18 acetylase RimI-like enzyme
MIRLRPARTVDLPGVAAVLQDAFSEKIRILFGHQQEKVRRLLEAVYVGPIDRGYDGVLVAEREGRIVGTLTIEPMFYTPEERRALESLALRELGMPRMLRTAFLLWLISHTPEPDDAHLGDLGVASDCQGQGIGTELLLAAEDWARDHDRHRLTLWVAESNERALALYENAGFVVTRTHSGWLTRLAFGVRRWYFMEKSLGSRDLVTVPPSAGF